MARKCGVCYDWLRTCSFFTVSLCNSLVSAPAASLSLTATQEGCIQEAWQDPMDRYQGAQWVQDRSGRSDSDRCLSGIDEWCGPARETGLCRQGRLGQTRRAQDPAAWFDVHAGRATRGFGVQRQKRLLDSTQGLAAWWWLFELAPGLGRGMRGHVGDKERRVRAVSEIGTFAHKRRAGAKAYVLRMEDQTTSSVLCGIRTRDASGVEERVCDRRACRQRPQAGLVAPDRQCSHGPGSVPDDHHPRLAYQPYSRYHHPCTGCSPKV